MGPAASQTLERDKAECKGLGCTGTASQNSAWRLEGVRSHAEGATPADGQYSPLFPRAQEPLARTSQSQELSPEVGTQGSSPPHEGRGA